MISAQERCSMRSRLLAVSLLAILGLPVQGHARPRAAVPAFLGTWKLFGVMTSKGPVPQEKVSQGALVWQFLPGGRIAIIVSHKGRTARVGGTWSLDGNVITVVETGRVPQRMTYKRTGPVLALTNINGLVTLRFKRVGR
jgi:hypothetical protein